MIETSQEAVSTIFCAGREVALKSDHINLTSFLSLALVLRSFNRECISRSVCGTSDAWPGVRLSSVREAQRTHMLRYAWRCDVIPHYARSQYAFPIIVKVSNLQFRKSAFT